MKVEIEWDELYPFHTVQELKKESDGFNSVYDLSEDLIIKYNNALDKYLEIRNELIEVIAVLDKTE